MSFQINHPPPGDFSQSGLPEYFKGSWENAAKIIGFEGVMDHPHISYMTTCISLTSENHHLVRRDDYKYSCDCERYKNHNLCAHIIAVSHHHGNLMRALLSAKIGITDIAIPPEKLQSGKKENEKNKRKKRTTPRDISTFSDPFQCPEKRDTSKYEVVFIRNTRSTTCYGCGGK